MRHFGLNIASSAQKHSHYCFEYCLWVSQSLELALDPLGSGLKVAVALGVASSGSCTGPSVGSSGTSLTECLPWALLFKRAIKCFGVESALIIKTEAGGVTQWWSAFPRTESLPLGNTSMCVLVNPIYLVPVFCVNSWSLVSSLFLPTLSKIAVTLKQILDVQFYI